MLDTFSLGLIGGTFLLAGTVKGVVGLGLPTVSLGLLTLAFDLTTGMALLIAPSFVTNIWQAAAGGHGRELLRRTWPFLLTAVLTIWLGALAWRRVDANVLTALLGLVLAAYAALGLTGLRLTISPRQARWAGPLFGSANGLLTGLTGSFVVPGVMYLQALGLSRDALVQAMGMLFTVSTVALALALRGGGLLDRDLAVLSTLAMAPAVLGMLLGSRLRRRLSEQRFQEIFFVGVLLLGAAILAGAVRAQG